MAACDSRLCPSAQSPNLRGLEPRRAASCSRESFVLLVTALRTQANKAACVQNLPGHRSKRRGQKEPVLFSELSSPRDSCTPGGRKEGLVWPG